MRALVKKKEAWKWYRKCKDQNEKDARWRYFKWRRNRAKKAIRKAVSERNKKLMKEIENIKTHNPREFWRKLRNLGKNKGKKTVWDTAINEDGVEVAGERIKLVWSTAYKNLGAKGLDKEEFNDAFADEVRECIVTLEKNSKKESYDELDELIKEIEMLEVTKIVKRLVNGKAAGTDGIVNEILKYGGEHMHQVIWHICKKCFELETIPEDWMKGMIFPIYKDGDRRDPLNYRGITLLSVVSKVYTSILNERLSKWCEKNNIIVEEQGGFRKGRSCTDQIFVLAGLLNKRRDKKTFCCFIDLRKAYDRVWREGLWKRLWDEGVRGKMWRVIKNLYTKVQSCVLLGREKTQYFNVDEGVRQGCVLSPILFSIFINKLAKDIINSGLGIPIKGRKVALLLYADDIVLIANSRKDLNRGLEIAGNFGYNWRCKYNAKKTQVVIFGKGKKEKLKWKIGAHVIQQVDSYKYLGIEMENKLKWKLFKRRLIEKAEKNMCEACAMGMRTG
ncbi:MAG: reverse transcriptase family protein, partial [Psychroserpens sp.]|nr:reverse transcriptase family protein [Psychroserpens sp.]